MTAAPEAVKPDRSSGPAPLFHRRDFAVFGAIAMLWTALSWLAVERHTQDRTAALARQNTEEIRQAVVVVSANVDRVFNRLQGMAALIAGTSDVRAALASFGPGAGASPLDYGTRKASWTGRAELSALNRQLRAAVEDVGVDILWVMNAGGDCVAASNAEERTSLVGTNYADRSYFSSARRGKRDRLFAVGRVTKVPGLFFSAPAMSDGQFLGAVGIKSDLSRIVSALNHPNAFLTDDRGVVILAADHRLEMRALPGAAVHQLSSEQQLSLYLRATFDTLDTGIATGPEGMLRIAGSPHPHISARSDLPQHGITAHILMPLTDIDGLRGPALEAFFLLATSGILLAALGIGTRGYLARAREYRKYIKAKNQLLTQLNASLADLATIDPLTGLHNRRYLDDFLEREVARASRNRTPVAAIMIDIDHFKRFNDSFGHKAGDAVLQAIGALLNRHIRSSDLACRFGGEEFLLILPEATLEIAHVRCEGLRQAVRELRIANEGAVLGPVTISLGLALLPQHAATASALIAAADAALYEAKNAGRDRLVWYAARDEV